MYFSREICDAISEPQASLLLPLVPQIATACNQKFKNESLVTVLFQYCYKGTLLTPNKTQTICSGVY